MKKIVLSILVLVASFTGMSQLDSSHVSFIEMEITSYESEEDSLMHPSELFAEYKMETSFPSTVVFNHFHVELSDATGRNLFWNGQYSCADMILEGTLLNGELVFGKLEKNTYKLSLTPVKADGTMLSTIVKHLEL